MTVTVIAPKDYASFRRCLRDLGYTPRRGKHEVWSKEGEQNFILPLTPSDWRGFQNDLARLKRRHPDAFPEIRKSENRPTKDQRRARSRRRSSRPSLALAINGTAAPERSFEPVPEVPTPGSPQAVSAGCICNPYENHHGAGVNRDGETFVFVKGCPVHVAEWSDESVRVNGNPKPKPSQSERNPVGVRFHGAGWQAYWLENGRQRAKGGFATAEEASRFRRAQLERQDIPEPVATPEPDLRAELVAVRERMEQGLALLNELLERL